MASTGGEGAGAAVPPASELTSAETTEFLALPAPDNESGPEVTLNVATGEPVSLDHLGPVIVTTAGGLERISNWNTLTDREQQVNSRAISTSHWLQCPKRHFFVASRTHCAEKASRSGGTPRPQQGSEQALCPPFPAVGASGAHLQHQLASAAHVTASIARGTSLTRRVFIGPALTRCHGWGVLFLSL